MTEPLSLDNPLDDPFADQLEWLRHRYDPGHFLGGTLRPELRLTLGARAKRFAAALAFSDALGALSLLVVVSVAMHAFIPDPFSLAVGILSLLVGIKMWTLANFDDRQRRSEPCKSWTFQGLAWMLPLATGVAVLGLAALLFGGTLVAAAIHGHAGALAAIAVLITIVAVVRRQRSGE